MALNLLEVGHILQTRLCSHLWPDARIYPPHKVKKAVVLIYVTQDLQPLVSNKLALQTIYWKPIELLTHKIGAALYWLLQFHV